MPKIITIDWKMVDQMMTAGCSGREIAGYLKIDSDTFYSRFKKEHKESFSALSEERKKGGYALIRWKQFQSAMRGNTQMLKLLGEEWLDQGKVKEDSAGSESRDSIILLQKLQKLEDSIHTGGDGQSGVEDQQSLLDQGCSGEEDQVSDEQVSGNSLEGETCV
jgi:hypothetical protein